MNRSPRDCLDRRQRLQAIRVPTGSKAEDSQPPARDHFASRHSIPKTWAFYCGATLSRCGILRGGNFASVIVSWSRGQLHSMVGLRLQSVVGKASSFSINNIHPASACFALNLLAPRRTLVRRFTASLIAAVRRLPRDAHHRTRYWVDLNVTDGPR